MLRLTNRKYFNTRLCNFKSWSTLIVIALKTMEEVANHPTTNLQTGQACALNLKWGHKIECRWLGTFETRLAHQVALASGRSHSCSSRTFTTTKYERVQLQKKKRRLDEVCLERYQQYSRTFIQSWILQGKVLVDGRVINKAGTPVSEKSVVEIKAEIPKYSRIQVRGCYSTT